jgi:hypothetical protein
VAAKGEAAEGHLKQLQTPERVQRVSIVLQLPLARPRMRVSLGVVTHYFFFREVQWPN